MYNKVFFYNHGHLGDVLLSKYFIKEVIKILDAKDIIFVNSYDNSYTSDISSEHIHLSSVNLPSNILVATDDANNLYFNTWYGQCLDPNNSQLRHLGLDPQDRFNLKSQDGILYNWENYYFFFNATLKTINSDYDLSYMLQNKISYVSYTQENSLDIPFMKDTRLKILIFNQEATSGQADNESFDSYIEELAKNKNIVVYCSKPTVVKADNLICLADFISYPDLFKISTLSKCCNIICGPGNATTIATWGFENLSDSNKTYITINRNSKGEAILFEEVNCNNIVVDSTKNLFLNLNKLI
jgi:hypothetical protein